MDTWLVDTLPPNVFYTPVQGGFYVNDTIRYTSAYFAGELPGLVFSSIRDSFDYTSTTFTYYHSVGKPGAIDLRLAQAGQDGEGRRLCL